MKKIKILLPLLTLFSLTLATPALAVETSPATTPAPTHIKAREEIKQIRNTAKTEIKEVRSEKREEVKTQQTALKQKRAESIYKAIRNELVKRFDVLTQTKTKITNRIAEKEKAGKDMTAAKTKLAEISKYETAYSSDLAAFDAKFAEISTAKPSTLVAELKTISTRIRSDLNSMRQVLVDSLKLVVKTK